ncbi:DUF21 domain-containing protein [Candidatus Poribacteria bacterium]|nr:DUF21 domain-containing protein [Candidatus Poribacteria bacterium]
MLLLLFLALVFLLALNAFFVLAEFSIVKMRPTRVEELAEGGDPRAKLLQSVHTQMDAYLSDCQVGITLASVALGMVGERAIRVVLGEGDPGWLRYALATVISYVIVSGSHILVGELVPKSIAIRIADRASLWVAAPLHFFHLAFFPAVWLLNLGAMSILRLFGVSTATHLETHTRGELRIILDQSQEHGMMSFRRLLFMENIFDLGDLTVRDAMRPRSTVKCLDARQPWDANLQIIRGARFTRYPVMADDSGLPKGFVHLKDLVIRAEASVPDLEKIARPILTTTETTPLEQLLSEMQRRSIHVALVTGPESRWTGFISLEDVIEELVGSIRDEFEDEEPVRLADALAAEHVHLGVPGETVIDAVRAALERTPRSTLPLSPDELLRAVEQRERQVSTYLGHGLVLPHARLNGLAKPLVMILRSDEGVKCGGTAELGHLLFVLITPAGQPRIHQRLQSIVAMLLHESDYVHDRLLTAETAAEVLDVIRTGEQAALG